MEALRSKKQKQFVQEYLIDFNASQAAIRAGYSPKAAGSIGFENMQKPAIQAAIAKALNDRVDRTLVTQDMVIEGLLKEAKDRENGAPSARVSAWEKLGKHLGIFEMDNSQKAPKEIIISRRSRDK